MRDDAGRREFRLERSSLNLEEGESKNSTHKKILTSGGQEENAITGAGRCMPGKREDRGAVAYETGRKILLAISKA